MFFEIKSVFNTPQKLQLIELYQKPFTEGYILAVTGNACKGDEIAFAEAIYTGTYPNAKFAGFYLITGTIVKDSYGAKMQQHTFTILTTDGETIRRKGRNIYKFLTLMKPRNETERKANLEDKYKRGEEAKAKKNFRKNWMNPERRYDVGESFTGAFQFEEDL